MPPVSRMHQKVNAAAIQATPVQPKCFPTSLASFSYQHLSKGIKSVHPDRCGVVFDTRHYYYYYYMIYIALISRIESEALASLGGEHD